jgi:hypothetical protein
MKIVLEVARPTITHTGVFKYYFPQKEVGLFGEMAES